jgi:hypothetical protein
MKNIFLLFLFSLNLNLIGQNKITDKTKNWKVYNGYFTNWWDATNGKIWLQVDKFDQYELCCTPRP